MKFDPPVCPKCGEPPQSMTEMLLCHAPLLPPDEEGEVEYDNDPGCKLIWDSQTPWLEDGEHVNLNCACGHSWAATVCGEAVPGIEYDPDLGIIATEPGSEGSP